MRTDELAEAGGEPCPEVLPIGEDPSGLGFGVEESADQLPALLAPMEAWVCRYDSANGGTALEWRRDDRAEPVPAADLSRLGSLLDDLALPDAERACTDDLGPRWLITFSHDGDLTGVVIDDYGCRDVRLTANPHTTPPGEGGQEGVVAGVLDGGFAILDMLGVGSTR